MNLDPKTGRLTSVRHAELDSDGKVVEVRADLNVDCMADLKVDRQGNHFLWIGCSWVPAKADGATYVVDMSGQSVRMSFVDGQWLGILRDSGIPRAVH